MMLYTKYGRGGDFTELTFEVTPDTNTLLLELKLPCLFLTAENRCLVYAERPKECREFYCDETQARHKVYGMLKTLNAQADYNP